MGQGGQRGVPRLFAIHRKGCVSASSLRGVAMETSWRDLWKSQSEPWTKVIDGIKTMPE